MKIAILRTDGGVSIMELTHEVQFDSVPEKFQAAVIEAEIAATEIPYLSYAIIDSVPQDRTFRNAWAFDGSAVAVDMDKAREIQRDLMRKARAPLLADLDTQFMKALETGADTSAIVAAKQELRDVTKAPEIEAAQTPEELKAVWPAEAFGASP